MSPAIANREQHLFLDDQEANCKSRFFASHQIGNKFSMEKFGEAFKSLPFEKVYSFDRKTVTRSSCWFTKHPCSCSYKYGKTNKAWSPHPFPKWMDEMASELCKLYGVDDGTLNSCNANLYENNKQDLYWHSDNEDLFRLTDFQRESFIVSVSFGASREFRIRKKFSTLEKPLELRDGDVLSMEGLFQDKYDHILKKGEENLVHGSHRVNLTFRVLCRHLKGCPMRKR